MKKCNILIALVCCLLLIACGSDTTGSDGDFDNSETSDNELDGDDDFEFEQIIDGDMDEAETEETAEYEAEAEDEPEAEAETEEESSLTYCYQKPCTYHATCTDTVDGAVCKCDPGYRGDGYEICDDINECEEGTDTCDPMTGCINNPGGFNCGVCPEDYTGNASAGCIPVTTEHLRALQLGSSDYTISVYSNYPFDLESEDVSEILIFIPEKGVDFEQYYLSVYDLARKARATARTFIIVPMFKISTDSLAENEIFWDSENSWLWGEQTAGETFDISSYKVVDYLIGSLDSAKLPNIKGAIIAGHKTGADFAQRYAATNKLVDSLDIGFRYIVSSSDSYLYISNERKSGESFSSTVDGCADYNSYPYGLLNLNQYATLAGSSYISTKYNIRDVYYIAGSDDTATDEEGFDSSCSATVQGENRLERAEIFKEYMNYYAGKEIHNLIEVEETAADLNGLFSNQAVKEAAFNVWVE